MEVGDFVRLFRGSVRSLVDWGRLQEHCSTSIEVVTSKDALGELSTVWYRSPSGALSGWRDMEAMRLRVDECAHLHNFPSYESANHLRKLVSQFNRQVAESVFCFPAIRTRDETLLLDGNHRCVALYRSDMPVRILLAIASGSADEYLLPDLLHNVGISDSTRWAHAVSLIESHFQLDGQGYPSQDS